MHDMLASRYELINPTRRQGCARFSLIIGLIVLCQNARCMVSIAPTRVDLVVAPGAQQQFSVRVGNTAKTAFTCQMSAENFSMAENGMPSGVPASGPRSAGSWITFAPAQFRLEPGGTRNVICKIAIPKGASGGYYAVVGALGLPEREPGSSSRSGAVINLSYKANAVVLAVAKSGRLHPELTLRDLSLVPQDGSSTTKTRRWVVRALVENSGNVHAVAGGSAEVRDSAGRRIWQSEIRAGKGLVVPGFPRVFESSPVTLPKDDYLVCLRMTASQRVSLTAASPFRVGSESAKRLEAGGAKWARSASIAISPGEVMLAGPVGARRTSSITIRNLQESAATYAVSLSDIGIGENGTPVTCKPGESAIGASQLVQVSPSSVTIAPGASAFVRVTATIPKDLQQERYASLILTPVMDGESHVAPTAAMLVVSPAGARTSSVTIGELAVSADKSGTKLTCRLTNSGDMRVVPRLQWRITDTKGSAVGDPITVTDESGDILPTAARAISVDLPNPLAAGKYSASAAVVGEDGKPIAQKSVQFTVSAASHSELKGRGE